MRISDWSSDVCSSDLPSERAAVTVGRLVAHLATLRQMSLSVAGMLQAGRSPALEGALVKELGGVFEQSIPGIAQIGRASSRESVCQYGSISVGAVSLKKNNKQTKANT